MIGKDFILYIEVIIFSGSVFPLPTMRAEAYRGNHLSRRKSRTARGVDAHLLCVLETCKFVE
jgi:hypothetical protein